MSDRRDDVVDLERPFSLLGSFDISEPSELHRLIRDARAGDPGAAAEVRARARRALESRWSATRDGVVVPVPGHLAGGAGLLVESLASTIAAERGWAYAMSALRRDRPVAEAKRAGARNLRNERATLVWTPPPVGGTIVLIDDVVRTGLTLRACAAAIRASDDNRPIITIVLATALDRRASPGNGDRVPHHA